MKNLLSKLSGNEAILLMYLADELPPQDRAEVEALLRQDGAFRRQLEELRGAMEVVEGAFAIGDPVIAARAEKCARDTIASMRQWQAAPPPVRIETKLEEKKLPLPWWSYPLAAAASILVAAAVFFANFDPAPMLDPVVSRPMAAAIPDLLSSPVLSDLATWSMDPYERYAMAEELAASFDESQRILFEGNLLKARQEVSAIQSLSNDAFAAVDWLW